MILKITPKTHLVPFGSSVLVLSSETGKAQVADAASLANAWPRIFATTENDQVETSPATTTRTPDATWGATEASALGWYLRRAEAVHFLDREDFDGSVREKYARTAGLESFTGHSELASHSLDVEPVRRLLTAAVARASWVQRAWPDSDPNSFSMSFGRAIQFATFSSKGPERANAWTIWVPVSTGISVGDRIELPPPNENLGSTDVWIDVLASVSVYMRRYRHELALKSLLLEVGRLAGDLIAAAINSDYSVEGIELLGSPDTGVWTKEAGLIRLIRVQLRLTGSAST